MLACDRAVVWRYLAALFPHKPVRGDASSKFVLPNSAGDGSNGMGTFQRAIGVGSAHWDGILRCRRISGELANCCQIVARLGLCRGIC